MRVGCCVVKAPGHKGGALRRDQARSSGWEGADETREGQLAWGLRPALGRGAAARRLDERAGFSSREDGRMMNAERRTVANGGTDDVIDDRRLLQGREDRVARTTRGGPGGDAG